MFEGCGTALVTPFNHDLSLDEERLRLLVRRQIFDGIHFLGANSLALELSKRGIETSKDLR